MGRSGGMRGDVRLVREYLAFRVATLCGPDAERGAAAELCRRAEALDPAGGSKKPTVSGILKTQSGWGMRLLWPIFGDALDLSLTEAVEEARRWATTAAGREWMRRQRVDWEANEAPPKNLVSAIDELRAQGVTLSSRVLAYAERRLAESPRMRRQQHATWATDLRVWQRMDDAGQLESALAEDDVAAADHAKDLAALREDDPAAIRDVRSERNRRGRS